MSISVKPFCKKRAFLLFFCMLSVNGTAQQNPPHFSEDLHRGVLDNKMEYFVQKNTKQQGTLFYLVLKVGAIDERDQQLGHAHFIEHLAFKGGRRFQKKSFVQYLEEQGLEVGRHYNGITYFEHTVYLVEFPGKITTELQQKTIAFFADILDGLTIHEDQVEKERKVILEEKRISTPLSANYKFKVGNSPYKDRIGIIGTEKSIKTATKKSLVQFYKECYQPQNAAVFVVGNVNPKETISFINQQLSSIKNHTAEKNPKDDLYRYLDTAVKIDISEKHRQTVLFLEWPLRTPKAPIEKASNDIFQYLLQKRLRTISQKDASRVEVSSDHFAAGTDYISVSCNVEPTTIPNAIRQIFREIKRISIHGAADEELGEYLEERKRKIDKHQQYSKPLIEKYKDVYLGIRYSLSYQREDSILATINTIHIKKEACKLWDSDKLRVFVKTSSGLKDNITLLEIKDIKTKVNSENLKPLDFDPQAEKQTKKQLANDYTLKVDVTGDEKPIEKYVFSLDITHLDFDPQAEKQTKKQLANNYTLKVDVTGNEKPIEKHVFSKLDITHLKYKNGLEVFLKPIQNNTNTINFSGFSPGGTSAIPDSLYYKYGNAASYMDLGGVGNLNDAELDHFLENKEMQIWLSVSEYQKDIRAYTQNTQIVDFLKWLHLKMTASRQNKKDFEESIQDQIEDLISGDAPEVVDYFNSDLYQFNAKIAELENSYFPSRRSAETKIELKNLDLSEMSLFYHKAFGNANGWKFAVEGDFEKDSIEHLLNMYLGELPYSKETLKNATIFDENNFPKVQKIAKKPDKTTTRTAFILYGNYTPGVEGSILLSLTKELIAHNIRHVLREQYGLVYHPVFELEKNHFPKDFFTLGIDYVCKSENTEKSKILVQKTLEDILKKRLSRKQLKSYKERIASKHNSVIYSEDIFHSTSGLLESLKNGEKIEDLENFTTILSNISTRQFHEFLKSTLELDRTKMLVQ